EVYVFVCPEHVQRVIVKGPAHVHNYNFQFWETDRHIFKQQWIGKGNPEFWSETLLRIWPTNSCVEEHRNVIPLREFRQGKTGRVIERMSAVWKPKLANCLPLACLPFGLKLGNGLGFAVTPMIVCSQKTIRIPLHPRRNDVIIAANHPFGNVILVHFGE